MFKNCFKKLKTNLVYLLKKQKFISNANKLVHKFYSKETTNEATKVKDLIAKVRKNDFEDISLLEDLEILKEELDELESAFFDTQITNIARLALIFLDEKLSSLKPSSSDVREKVIKSKNKIEQLYLYFAKGVAPINSTEMWQTYIKLGSVIYGKTKTERLKEIERLLGPEFMSDQKLKELLLQDCNKAIEKLDSLLNSENCTKLTPKLIQFMLEEIKKIIVEIAENNLSPNPRGEQALFVLEDSWPYDELNSELRDIFYRYRKI